MPSIPPTPVMAIDQASAYLGVGKDILYTLAARDEIPHFHVGRFLRFRLDDLDQWSRSHEHRRLTSLRPNRKAASK